MVGRAKRLVFAAAAIVGVSTALPSTVLAHAEFVSSTPAAGATVEGPLTEVELVFLGTPRAVDGGIAAANSAGVLFDPVSIDQDGLVVVATFDPPLGAGTYALSWRVRSDDTHFINGALSFTVDVPVATTEVAEPSDVDESGTTADVAETETTPNTTAATGAAPVAPVLDGADGDGERVARIGRLILFPSTVAALGILAFAAFAFSGRRADLGALVRVVRWLGVGIAFGALIEVVGLTSLFGGFADLLDEGSGRAAFARIIGGVLITVGILAVSGTTRPLLSNQAEPPPRPRASRSLSAAVLDDPTTTAARADGDDTADRWRPSPVDRIGLAGIVIVTMSFAFDGHTVSSGPRAIHALVSVVHVAAAGVWAGGLVALAVVLSRRYRDGSEHRALQMILPFSVVAMGALVVAGIAGVVMALFIDNDIVGYTSTEWGRYMLIKSAVVGLAVAIATYNHFRVMPAMRSAPDDPAVVARARSTVTAEALLVVAASAVTGLLVAASTIA